MKLARSGLFLLFSGLAGCQSYHPQPLPAAATPARLPVAPPAGFSTATLARFALAHNPDLIAARDARGVKQAAAEQLGLLPNPQLAASFAPTLAGPGPTPAWSAGFTQDVTALLTLRARRAEAKADLGAADADLLWREFQTLAAVRTAVTDVRADRARLALLARALPLTAAQNAEERQAYAAALSDAAALSTATANAQDWRNQYDEQQRTLASDQGRLAGLLGIAPGVAIRLADEIPPPAPPVTMKAIDDLPGHRPDLIALRLGYAAQDARVRAAVLAQYPDLALGLIGGSDNTGVRSLGPQITLGLPLFDRGTAALRGETATRRQLYDEYQARLLQSRREALQLVEDGAALQTELDQLNRELNGAQAASDAAAAAARRGLIDGRTARDLESGYFTRALARITAQQNLADQRIALDLLLGRGLPDAAPLLAQTEPALQTELTPQTEPTP